MGPEAWHSLPGASGSGALASQRLSLPTPIPRLIKGDGEVLEEIVTKERHREINKVGVAPLPRPTPSSSSDLSPPSRVLSSPASHPRGWPGLPDASRAPALSTPPPRPPAKACYTQCWHDLEAGLRVGSGEPAACSFSCRPASGPASSPMQGVEVGVTGQVSSPISQKSAPSQILNVPWLETSSVLLLFVLRGRE